jgi:hypothetical protein
VERIGTKSGKPARYSAAASILLAVALLASPASEAASPQGSAPARLGFTTKLASGVRTQDLRKQVPPALADRNLPGGLTELANPYLPDDRRIFRVVAIALHPEGGIVFWADAKHFASNDDSEEFSGLWRMAADGRITPFAVESEQQFQRGGLHCGASFEMLTVGRPASLVVEPQGDVLMAGSAGAVFRVHKDGFVERVAGGGEKYCGDKLHGADTGYRDGPGSQALFSDDLVIAQAKDGGIFVTEQQSTASHALARIRHIDAHGVVTTVYTGENCYGRDCPTKAQLGVDSILVDRDGALIVADQGVQHNAKGQEQGFARAHRFDPATGKSTLIAYSVDQVPEPGVPFDSFRGLALLPDGRPISRSLHGGYIVLDGPKPAFTYWLKWTEGRYDDGPLATTGFAGNPFCVAADGSIYMASDRGVRRLDPQTRRVATWLR